MHPDKAFVPPNPQIPAAELVAMELFQRMTPLRDRVLVKRIPQSDGTIIAPDIAKPYAVKALVIAVGPGKIDDGELIPMWVKRGDVLCFSGNLDKHEWHDVLKHGDFVLIQQNDILGLVEEDARIEFSAEDPDYERD